MVDAVKPPAVSEKPLLLVSWLCPYVQRVWVALNARGIEYDRVDIDLTNKPSWLTEYSPLGKVPAVTYKEPGSDALVVLYESLPLLEWVDETDKAPADAPSLLPKSATQRALARITIARFNDKLVPLWYKLVSTTSRDEALELARTAWAELGWLEGQLSAEGPYFLGPQLSAVDCAILPWLLRANVLQHFRGFDALGPFPRLQAYVAALKAHPAVLASQVPPPGEDWYDAMIEAYTRYGREALPTLLEGLTPDTAGK